MTAIRWLLLAVSILIYRVWFPVGPLPLGVRLDYDLVVIVLVGLYRGVTIGTVAGWGLGLLTYGAEPERMAWTSLLGALVGWTVGLAKERLFMEYPIARWLIFWMVMFLYKTIHLMIAAGGDFGLWLGSLWGGVLASTGLSATVALVVSVFWEKSRRVRAGGTMISVAEDVD